MSTMFVFLTVRVVHILMAALWLGGGVFISLFLFPTVKQLGPLGGEIMLTLSRRKLQVFMPVISVTTMLTGLWLYWQFTTGFTAAVTHSAPGLTFGLGGLAGLTALIIGGAVIGRSVKRMVALVELASSLPEGREKATQLQAAAALQERMAGASKLMVALIVTAIVLMALGHYV